MTQPPSYEPYNLHHHHNNHQEPPSYEPYNLHHHHNNNHQEPPEYYHPHPINHHTITHSYLYNEPPPAYIPIEQRHISTLFVSGLPDDVHPREIHNLFRRRPGFDYCQLKFTGHGNQVVAFVTFFNHQSAVMALQALDGVKFDPQAGSALHIELARSNSRRKRKSGSGPYVVIDKRRKATDYEETSSDDGGNYCIDPDVHSTVKSDRKNEVRNDSGTAKKTEKSPTGDLQPCSTLFIANLGPKCSEEELREALSPFPGLNGMKLRTKSGMRAAFVDFEEIEQATAAMEALQDSMLPSSDRGSMHIEYARSKMRKP